MKALVVVGLLSLLVSCSAETPAVSPDAARRAEQDARTEKLLGACRFALELTVAGSTEPARQATYTVTQAAKTDADAWRLDGELWDGSASSPLSLVARVQWAGDTAVVEAVDVQIPGVGACRARLAVFGGDVVGLWSNESSSGGLGGRLERDAWGSWRGPESTGVARGANPPTTWAEDKNIRWKVPIPGRAASSPVVWGDRVYVTTAIETDEPGTPVAEGRPDKVHEFVVLALDRKDGSTVWRKVVTKAVPHENGHKTATQASHSPIVDGARVYAYFGSRGLYCLDRDGEVLWSKDLGRMNSRARFGEGSSPALHGNKLVVTWDHEGSSFLVVFDKLTGDELWRRDRDEATSWSTPVVVPVGGRAQIVTAATKASRGYDLETGDLLWSCTGMTDFCVATPVFADGLVYLISGFKGNSLQALRLADAQGDISGTDAIAWNHGRNTSYAPSPLLYDGLLYFLQENTSVLSCLDARTGEVHYERQRLRMRTVYSSPAGAAGRVYVTARDGTTKVIRRGVAFEEIATNQLEGEDFDASPALVGNELFLRGGGHLYCIAETGGG